jgi:hypothetical protein
MHVHRVVLQLLHAHEQTLVGYGAGRRNGAPVVIRSPKG